MVTLTTGMMLFLFKIACSLGCGEFYEGVQRVRRQPVKWSEIAESLRNTDINYMPCSPWHLAAWAVAT
jgi:hypothetical protein